MHDALESFLEIDNLPPSKIHLLEILNDPTIIQIELAITVDAGEPFVKATYCMKGDRPLVFSAYEEISTPPDSSVISTEMTFQLRTTEKGLILRKWALFGKYLI